MGRDEDTIFAPSTPGGGAISVIRISGNDAHRVLDSVFKRTSKEKEHARLYHGFLEHAGMRVDEVMAVYFYAPRSYTGEDMGEIHCHGSRMGLLAAMRALSENGARLADPGEFTKRAYLAGKMDLSAAGAVMDLINASSEAGANAALKQLSGGLFDKITSIQERITDALAIIEAGIEYPEEDLEADIRKDALPLIISAKEDIKKLAATFESGRMLIEGYSVVIAGRPNVGKSSLFNMLLGKDRAIVTHIPGTTRDSLDDRLMLDGALVRLVDTAGMRESSDAVERLGVARTEEALKSADLVLFVTDASEGVTEADREIFRGLGKNVIIVQNKCDLGAKAGAGEIKSEFGAEPIFTSALTGEGRETLLKKISPPAYSEAEDVVITNERHYGILDAARKSLDSAIGAFDTADLDCVTIDIKEAWDKLGEITGVTATAEIINEIFDKFCLGK